MISSLTNNDLLKVRMHANPSRQKDWLTWDFFLSFISSLFIWGIGDGTQRLCSWWASTMSTNHLWLPSYFTWKTFLPYSLYMAVSRYTNVCFFWTCVFVCIHVCVSTGVPECWSQKSASGAFPHEPSLLISMARLWLDWLASKPHEPICFSLPNAGVTNICYHTCIFHMESWNWTQILVLIQQVLY